MFNVEGEGREREERIGGEGRDILHLSLPQLPVLVKT
jgi:hypothetical protein